MAPIIRDTDEKREARIERILAIVKKAPPVKAEKPAKLRIAG